MTHMKAQNNLGARMLFMPLMTLILVLYACNHSKISFSNDTKWNQSQTQMSETVTLYQLPAAAYVSQEWLGQPPLDTGPEHL